MANENYELDYEKMFTTFNALLEKCNCWFDLEKEAFKLAREIKNLLPYCKAFSKNFASIDKADTVRVMRILIQYDKLAKQMCEKYGWEVDIEEGEDDSFEY